MYLLFVGICFNLLVLRASDLLVLCSIIDRFDGWTAAQMLEQRIKRVKCTVRFYLNGNKSAWEPNLYGAEPVVHEQLLRSPHRTTNRALTLI